MFDPIQDYLPKTANKWGIGKEFRAIHICKIAEAVLISQFEHYGSSKPIPKNFKSGKLTIEVKSSGWAQEVAMRKEKIINAINKKTGKKLVKDLRTILSS